MKFHDLEEQVKKLKEELDNLGDANDMIDETLGEEDTFDGNVSMDPTAHGFGARKGSARCCSSCMDLVTTVTVS